MLHFFFLTIIIKTSELNNELQRKLDTFIKTQTEEIEKTNINNKLETNEAIKRINKLIESLEHNEQNDTIKSKMKSIKTDANDLKKDVVKYVLNERNKIVKRIDSFCCELPESLQKQCNEKVTNCLLKKTNEDIIEKELEEVVSVLRNAAKITNNINAPILKEKLEEFSRVIETIRHKLFHGVIDTFTEFNIIFETKKINPVLRHREVRNKLSPEEKTIINEINDQITKIQTEFGLVKKFTVNPENQIERLLEYAEKQQKILKVKEDCEKIKDRIKNVSVYDQAENPIENLTPKLILLESESEKLQKNILGIEKAIDTFYKNNNKLIDDTLINIEESVSKIQIYIYLLRHHIFLHCYLDKNNMVYNENDESRCIYGFLKKNEILMKANFLTTSPTDVYRSIKNKNLEKNRFYRLIFLVHESKEKIISIHKLESNEHIKNMIDRVDSFISECFDMVKENGVTKYDLKENILHPEINAAFRIYKIRDTICDWASAGIIVLIVYVLYKFYLCLFFYLLIKLWF